jgi:hypothetical protein
MTTPNVSAARLLADALAAATNHPEPDQWGHNVPQHPEDAWGAASAVLATVAGLRIAEWQAARDTR